ncbi:hypothetical protein [Chelativorans sp. YIM 93263]|uniref:hypothetical protein n=1 Tax=Chelativorans sp. YIM 93263 TaxID=2906648 RepID=UPI002377FC8E|nr:hypothetical protein [Chelativorans sp. YIM 93263]
MSQKSIHDRIMSRNQPDPLENAGDVTLGKFDRKWLKAAALSLLGVVVIAAAGYGAMRSDAVRGFFSQEAVAETKEAVPELADTPFLQHAEQAGLETCSTVFPALGELLTNGSQYQVQSTWNSEKPDEHAVQSLVGMTYQAESYTGTAAGFVFAAPTGSVCEGSMVRVAPFSRPCNDISALLPAGSKLANNLGNVAVYSLANNGGDALLLPAGETCIVVSIASAVQG